MSRLRRSLEPHLLSLIQQDHESQVADTLQQNTTDSNTGFTHSCCPCLLMPANPGMHRAALDLQPCFQQGFSRYAVFGNVRLLLLCLLYPRWPGCWGLGWCHIQVHGLCPPSTAFNSWGCTHLLRKPTGSNQFECFHLAKVCWIPQHVYIHELCNVSVPVTSILLPEGLPECCTLLCYDIPLLGRCFACPDSTYEVPGCTTAQEQAQMT
jgi:hypothetical protein